MHRSKPRRTSNYPISIFLSEFFNSLDLSVSEFVETLGYKKHNKGIARFDEWLQEGTGVKDFVSRFLQVFPEQREQVERALRQTESQKLKEQERHERAHFKPYIFLETKETRPSAIMFFALTGGSSKFIRLPNTFQALDHAEQIKATKTAIAKHQSEGGISMFFGPVTAYRLVPDFESNILFDTKGNILAEVQEHFQVPFRISAGLR